MRSSPSWRHPALAWESADRATKPRGPPPAVQLDTYREYYKSKWAMSDAEIDATIKRGRHDHARHAATHRDAITRACAAQGTPLASHDDATVSYVEEGGKGRQRLTILRVDRRVVLTVADWRTDTKTDNDFKTKLFYDLDLRVLDSSGKVLAQRRLMGHEDELRGAARDAFRQKLELMVNAPEVTQALSVRESPATAEPAAPAPPAPPRPPAASGAPPALPPTPDAATQLQKLKDLFQLYEKGLVTEDVYKEKMREILNKL